jgi:competence protein ComEA
MRTLVGAIAILGLSGIGAASMIAGLNGAHASPPEATSVWLAASASAAPRANTPVASNAAPNGPLPDVQAAAGQPAPATPEAAAPSPSCPTLTDDGKVIVNRAKVEDLRKIPGIGPKRAEAILALRAKLKRFKRPAELLRVKGIGAKSLVRMQPHFVLDDPKGNSCEQPTLNP